MLITLMLSKQSIGLQTPHEECGLDDAPPLAEWLPDPICDHPMKPGNEGQMLTACPGQLMRVPMLMHHL